jgi:hypothetical protein
MRIDIKSVSHNGGKTKESSKVLDRMETFLQNEGHMDI